jgi:hypothetical protein
MADILLEAEAIRIEAEAQYRGAFSGVVFYHPQAPEYQAWVTYKPSGRWYFSTTIAWWDVRVESRISGIRIALGDGFKACPF